MDEIIKLVDGLSLGDISAGELEGLINHIVLLGDDDREKVAEELVKKDFLARLEQTADKEGDNVRLVAQAVAELAKTESVRAECVRVGLMQKLIPHLGPSDVPRSTQICRALGNICYDYDEGRSVLNECSGLEKLVTLMTSLNDADVSEERQKLRMMVCGCMLNVTNMNETLQEKSVSLGIFPLLNDYLKKFCKNNDDLISMVLMTVSSLVDSEKCRTECVSCGLVETVIDLYELGTIDDIDDIEDSIIELLSTIAESDDVKTRLCATKLPGHLMESVRRRENSTNEDSLAVLKAAADLLMLLLIGNESMEALYHHGDSTVYQQCLTWMESSNEYMCMSGALAVGNYARGDAHSKQLVESGIHHKLLSVLRRQNDSQPSVLIVHAVLSALRNLAIPVANKQTLIETGVVEEAMRFRNSDMMPIQFKLLGLLRMLVDGQKKMAESLGTNKEFMEKLIRLCSVTDHAGVKGEAIRLLAWLVKHSHSGDVIRGVMTSEGLSHLVTMVTAEHTVMQNEALVALSIIAATVADEYSSMLAGSELVPTLGSFLSGNDLQSELLSNALTLTQSLVKSESLKDVISKNTELVSALRKLKDNQNSAIRDKTNNILTIIG